MTRARAEARRPPPDTCAAAPLSPAELDPQSHLSALIERVRSTVVTVSSTRGPQPNDARTPPRFPHGRGEPRLSRALGSGFVISEEGLVLTNDHVVSEAYGIEVRLADDRAFGASVIGRDPMLDVALLRLQGAEALPAASLGSSALVRSGDEVVVIGSPFGLGPTATKGIISATSRPLGASGFDNFLQTDAAINPGNSGGPVFDTAGQVIGITTAIHAEGQGISFAVPIDEVLAVLPELREKGHVSRGKMGISFQEVTAQLARALKVPDLRGALVTEVEPGSPAARLGLRPGDVITSLDGRHIEHARELARMLRRAKPEARVRFVYRRKGADHGAALQLDRPVEPAPRLTPPALRVPSGRWQDAPLGVLSSDAPGGARVEEVVPQSPAAGSLEVGDVVLDLNGTPVQGGADLSARLRAAMAQEDLLLRVRREGVPRYVVIAAR